MNQFDSWNHGMDHSKQSQNNGPNNGSKTSLQGQFYKTRMCPYINKQKSFCRRKDTCCYAHSEKELKSTVDLSKTRLCTNFQNGTCNKGDQCKFAHGQADLRSTNHCYKTQQCRKFNQFQYCKAGDACRHAHGEEEAELVARLKDEGRLDFKIRITNFSEFLAEIGEELPKSAKPKAPPDKRYSKQFSFNGGNTGVGIDPQRSMGGGPPNHAQHPGSLPPLPAGPMGGGVGLAPMWGRSGSNFSPDNKIPSMAEFGRQDSFFDGMGMGMAPQGGPGLYGMPQYSFDYSAGMGPGMPLQTQQSGMMIRMGTGDLGVHPTDGGSFGGGPPLGSMMSFDMSNHFGGPMGGPLPGLGTTGSAPPQGLPPLGSSQVLPCAQGLPRAPASVGNPHGIGRTSSYNEGGDLSFPNFKVQGRQLQPTLSETENNDPLADI